MRTAPTRRSLRRPSAGSTGNDQLVQVERQAAWRLGGLAGPRRNLFDEVDLPALLQDLLARQRAEPGAALKLLVFARKLVVVDRRGACGGSRPGDERRCGRWLFQQLGIVTDLFPILPGVLFAVDIHRVPDPEDERGQRRRSGGSKGERQCEEPALQF